ncbi:MAG: cation:proton antiporter [Candidatus Thermoplasmatota archaeon]
MDIATAFSLVGLVIFIGFSGHFLFERIKIPDILILIFLGLAIGPIFHLVDPTLFVGVTPYFASLALMIILFDGGLGLNFDKVLKQFGVSMLQTISAFLACILAITSIFYFIFRWDIITSLLISSIIGATSAPIVLPLVAHMKIVDDTRTVLSLESVITDVLSVVVVISLIQLHPAVGGDSSATSYKSALGSLASSFCIGIVVGGFVGIIWLKILKWLYGKPYSFMITIAALFLLYAGVETLGGSGAMASLLFGMVLANKEEVTRMLKMETTFVFDERIKQFHSEFAFFIRTFFFVYIGVVFTFGWATNIKYIFLFILTISIMFMAILSTRYIISFVTVRANVALKKDRTVIWIMLPRGLAAAVLASMVVSKGIAPPPTGDYIWSILDIVFMIILLTSATATVGTFVVERSKIKNEKDSS